MRRIAALFLVPSLVLPLVHGNTARGVENVQKFEDAQKFESDEGLVSVSSVEQTHIAERWIPSAVEVAQASFTTGTITVSKNLARQTAERENGGLDNYRAEPAMHGPVLDAPYRDGGDTWIFTFRGGAPGAEFTVESEIAVNKTSLAIDILYNGPLRVANSPANGPQNGGRPRNGSRNRNQAAQQQPPEEPPIPAPVATDPRQARDPSAEPQPAPPPQDQPSVEQPTVEQSPVEQSPAQPAEPPVASASAEVPADAPPSNPPSSERAANPPPPIRSLSAPGDITTAKNFARQAAERVNGGLTNYSAESSMHGPALESPFRDDGDRWIFTFRGGFPGDISLPIESEVAVSKSSFETTVLYNGPLRDGSLQ